MTKHPEWAYNPGMHERQARDISLSEGIGMDFFHVGVNAETGEYDYEDYFFVNAARQAGFKAFILPWIKTTHSGVYEFHCNVPAMVKLNQAGKEAAIKQLKEVA
jgi:hypothetical protein